MKRVLHEANRLSWNAATLAHNSHKGDQAAFLREGGSTLFAEELSLLGDVSGKSLLHLQCNSGQDSLSLAKLGVGVTGVDISDEAISFARELSGQSGIAAEFVRSDIYDYLAEAEGARFDLVFASYGVIGWLSDLEAWARGIARLLKPGGSFVLMEFHPFALIFDEAYGFHYDYFNREPIVVEEGIPDYVAASGDGLLHGAPKAEGIADFKNPHGSYEFDHGLGDVISSLAGAGLVIGDCREFPYSNGWKRFDEMQELPGRRWTTKAGMARIPLMYGLKARKPA